MKTKIPPPPPAGPPPPTTTTLASNSRQLQQQQQHHSHSLHVLPIVSLSTSATSDEEEEEQGDYNRSTVASATSTEVHNNNNNNRIGAGEHPKSNEAFGNTHIDRQRALLDDVVILSKSSSATSTSNDDEEEQQQKSDAMAYLLRYEIMVRQQEAEDMAVLAHMRPCVGRLLELMKDDDDAVPTSSSLSSPLVWEHDNMEFLTQEVSFVQLQHAVRRLEQSLQAKQSSSSNQSRSPMEHLTTDRQLMMVLRLLTQKVDSRDDEDDNYRQSDATTITWAEIVQCYKVCIAGMLTLQHLPPNTAARARARDRTLAMLSLFEPPSTQLFQEDFLLRKNKNVKQKNSQKLKQHHNNNNLKHAVVDSEPLTMASPRFVPLPSTDPTRNTYKARPAHRYGNTNRKSRRLLAVVAMVAMCIGLLYWYNGSNYKRTIETGVVSWTRPPPTPWQHESTTAPRSANPTHEVSSPSAPVTRAVAKRQWTNKNIHQQQPTWRMDPFVGASDRLGSTVWKMLHWHSKKSSMPWERRV